MSDNGATIMPARKSAESSPEPRRPGRPKQGASRPPDRVIIKGKPEMIRAWRAYVERHSPPHLSVPNGSIVFWEMFQRVLAEEKASKKNPKSG